MDESDLVECTQGYYCELGTSLQYPASYCPVGYYCPQGSPDKIPCPPGTYNSANYQYSLTGDCLPCTSGYYCDEPNTTSLTKTCAAGYYCNDESTDVGYTTDTPEGKECPVGYKCEAGATDKVECSTLDLYQDLAGQSTCEQCPAGITI